MSQGAPSATNLVEPDRPNRQLHPLQPHPRYQGFSDFDLTARMQHDLCELRPDQRAELSHVLGQMLTR